MANFYLVTKLVNMVLVLTLMNRLKIVNSGQGVIHEYENTKRKLLICNANIYFNKQCQNVKTSTILTSFVTK